MSIPIRKLWVMVLALLLANLLLVAGSSVDRPSSEPADTSDSDDDGSPRREMPTINDVVSDSEAAWESGGTYLSARHVALITNYETMCCAVLIAKQNGGAWDSEEAVHLRSIGLFSKEDVLKELDIITWPNQCSVPITLDRNSM